MLKNPLKPRAFSLIEVSVVIIIIGILISGVVVADIIVSKSRIAAAQNLTRSSPIGTFKDTFLWLESSLDSSFNPSEAQSGARLSTWYDQKNSHSKVIVSPANNGSNSPTYSNTINRIHAVEFDGTSNKYFTFDGSFLNGTDYIIIILEKRKSSKSNNYFLGTPGSGLNNSLALGYSEDNKIIHAQGSNSYPSGTSDYSSSKEKPRIFIFTHSASNGNQTYINGMLSGEDRDATSHLSGVSTVSIGQDYVGEIGEIAILTKALGAEERRLVEDYLSKKWSLPINKYYGSSSATCTASGTGYNKTNLAYTSGSIFSCNVDGYTGTINYKCLASGPASDVSGSCTPITCTASGTGYNKTGLAYAAGGSRSFACDSGYVGTINYTCTASGAATEISGSCTLAPCTGGAVDTTTVPGSTIHKFTTVGTSSFSCSTARNVQVLVVAGGGGGGGLEHGAGGGAGGVIYNNSFPVSTSPITVTVGGGGAANSQGSNSVFSTLTAFGGGSGGRYSVAGGSGGSGGGSAWSTAGLGYAGQGNNGTAKSLRGVWASGGGGGAGGIATDPTDSAAGNGGIGVSSSISGTPTYYGGGGGGSVYAGVGSSGGTGGLGGGGSGANRFASGSAGTPNTGGGGGGTGANAATTDLTLTGGAGGSGIVIVRYTN